MYGSPDTICRPSLNHATFGFGIPVTEHERRSLLPATTDLSCSLAVKSGALSKLNLGLGAGAPNLSTASAGIKISGSFTSDSAIN